MNILKGKYCYIPLDLWELEDAPIKDSYVFRENRARNLGRRYGDMWNTKLDGRGFKEFSPYIINLNHILKSHVGKHVDTAYSKFCSTTPVKYRYLFRSYINTSLYDVKPRTRYEYHVNSKGIIKKTKIRRVSYPIRIDSFDYEFGWYDTWFNKWVPYFSENFKGIVQQGRYEYRHKSGTSTSFSTKKSRKYKRLRAETNKARQLNNKRYKKYKKSKVYDFKHDVLSQNDTLEITNN